MTPLNQLSACESLAMINRKETSPRELARACFERIAERDPEIHAWQCVGNDAVLDTIEASVDERRKGPLAGLPLGIKDIFDTSMFPTRYGSPIYDNYIPSADAAVVARLRELGAIILGKTVTTEFAGWTPSQTRNPHDINRTPGGSSSGSAAAVADYMIPVALGTQTLGSILRPASYCGVVGFKPSYYAINRTGMKSLAQSLDTVGFFARTVTDVAAVYAALIGSPPFELDGAPPRLAFCRANWDKVDDDARQAIESYVEDLRIIGIVVDDLQFPEMFDRLAAAANLMHDFEVWRGFSDERLRHWDLLSDSFQAGLKRCELHSRESYQSALELGDECRRQFPHLVNGFDAVISLSAPGEAPRGNTTTGDPVMNSPWTLLHAPCVSIPVLQGRSGLPIGLQIITPRFRDADVLRVAHWLLNRARTSQA